MLDTLTSTPSRPLKIVRVLQALGMEVPARLRRERLSVMVEALQKGGIEVTLADGSPIDLEDSPGIEAKVRLRRFAERGSSEHLLGYEVIDKMPTSGMADCFKVRAGGAVRFLKMVRVTGLQGDALRRELDVYAKLERASAAHVLRVHEFKREGDRLALVTDFAEGGTLAQHVEKRGSLSASEVRAIAQQVVAGLVELHALDIIHRDLKPENILLCGSQWMLADFGISKNLSRLVTQGRTFQGSGTRGYAPPEQCFGRDAHPSADVYAFGKLVVFLMTGQTDVDHLQDPPAWVRFVRRCTEYVPERRPQLDGVAAELAGL
jgi:serine/threonine protein kinase